MLQWKTSKENWLACRDKSLTKKRWFSLYQNLYWAYLNSVQPASRPVWKSIKKLVFPKWRQKGHFVISWVIFSLVTILWEKLNIYTSQWIHVGLRYNKSLTVSLYLGYWIYFKYSFFLAFMGPCIVRIFQYMSNKMQRYAVYFLWKLLYMFRVVPPPIIRSANNCIYCNWYLSHRYCYLPL